MIETEQIEALKEFRAWRKVMRGTHTEAVYGEVFDKIEEAAARLDFEEALLGEDENV